VISHLNSINSQGGGEGEASAERVEIVADAKVEPADVPIGIEVTTLEPSRTSDPSDTRTERPATPAVVEEADSETRVRGVSPLEELADETAGLLEVLTDNLAEDILGAWSALPLDQELVADLV
jgi:hypothetical protein